jgi:phage I-like protein
MDLKQLIAALGLPADVTADKVIAAVKALAADSAKTRAAHSAMAKRLGLPEDAQILVIDQAVAGCLEAVNDTALVLGLSGPTKPAQLAACAKDLIAAKLGQAQTAATDPTKFVPMEQHMAVASRLTALETKLATNAATAAVDAAMKAGKVIPSTKEWALACASKDPEGFAAFVAAAPVILKPGPEGPGGRPPHATGEMGEEDLAVCSRLGIVPEEYKKNMQEGA